MHSGAAWTEAEALGHDWVGDEHFLLALTRTDSLAAKALSECGATYEALRDELARQLTLDEDHPFEPVWGNCQRELTPAAYELMGWAEGFAASRGDRPGTEDVLLAVLWHPNSLSSEMLKTTAVGRAAVKNRLGELGVPVPPIDPTPDDVRPVGPKVYFPPDKLDVVLREVQPQLPESSHFGWNLNHDGTKAYVSADPAVDLEALVSRALEREDAP
jgi:hypothetical protein